MEPAPVTWSKDLDELVEQLKEDEFLSVRDVQQDEFVWSFHLVFNGVLQWLVQLNKAGSLGQQLCALTNSTFNVEWQAYAWGSTGILIQRQVQGRWR